MELHLKYFLYDASNYVLVAKDSKKLEKCYNAFVFFPYLPIFRDRLLILQLTERGRIDRVENGTERSKACDWVTWNFTAWRQAFGGIFEVIHFSVLPPGLASFSVEIVESGVLLTRAVKIYTFENGWKDFPSY